MPTAYIYRGTFQVRSGETLRYVEVAADGTIGPEVAKSYAELAGIGSLSTPAVSLTPSVAAPSLSGVQIGAIAGASVSLQPVVSPAAVSGVQVGGITAASVSLRPTVAVPSVAGVRVGTIGTAVVSIVPTVAVGSLTGVVPVDTLADFSSTSALTTSGFSTDIVSTGSANLGTGNIALATTSAAGGSILRYDTPLPANKVFTVEVQAALNITSADYFFPIMIADAASLPGCSAPTPASPLHFLVNTTGALYAGSSRGVSTGNYYWNNSSWVTTFDFVAGKSISSGTQYRWIMESNGTQFRFSAYTVAWGLIFQTTWANWSALSAVSNNLYLVAGNFANHGSGYGTMTVQLCQIFNRGTYSV